MKVTLDYPPASLSPNKRLHWSKVSKAKAQYRKSCWADCKAAGWHKIDMAHVHVRITFHPPDKRRRDLDNMLSSFKAGIDGIVDAIGVDDSDWEITLHKSPDTKGCVVVELMEED